MQCCICLGIYGKDTQVLQIKSNAIVLDANGTHNLMSVVVFVFEESHDG